MKKKCFLMLMLLISVTSVQAQIQYFEWQGGQREYLVKTPSQNKEAMPVVYFLHGLGDTSPAWTMSFISNRSLTSTAG